MDPTAKLQHLETLVGHKVAVGYDGEPSKLLAVSRRDDGYIHFQFPAEDSKTLHRYAHESMLFVARATTGKYSSVIFKEHRSPTSEEFAAYGPHSPCKRRGYCDCPQPFLYETTNQ